MNYYSLLAIPVISFLGRVAGASWGPSQVGEVSVALAIGFCSYWIHGDFFAGLFHFGQYILPFLLAVSSYAAIQDGHGNVYDMGRAANLPDSPRGLDRKFRWIADIFGLKPRSTPYCWLLMGLKGLWIGLPIFPFGLPLAILWPTAYAIKDSLVGEWVSHFFLACILVVVFNYGA